MYRFNFVIMIMFLIINLSCSKKDEVIGNYKIEKLGGKKIENMYTKMQINVDNTFELKTDNEKNVIKGKWKLKRKYIIFYYDEKEVRGELKEHGGFIVNAPNDFHSGQFLAILYVKTND